MDILKIIEEKILENGQKAGYSHIAVSEFTASKPTVGIWWYVAGKVLKIEDFPENLPADSYLCVDVEHNKAWPFVQKHYAEKIPELLTVKYNEIERGRVWLVDNGMQPKHFLITCSSQIKEDATAIAKIKVSFGISGKRMMVKVDPQYNNLNIKIK